MASFWQQFSHSKRHFWLKPTIPEKFYIFWEWDEQKILQNMYDVVWYFEVTEINGPDCIVYK